MSLRLDKLQKIPVDLAIIGGGIQGAGVAREAALRGLSVALFEKGDFASGTSSRTSGLIHGGIRYLEQGAFHLVYQAVHERYTLSHLAPHLVRPIPFLFPIYQGEGRGKWKIRIGTLLYDFLAGAKTIGQCQMLNPSEVLSEEPALRSKDLVAAAQFYDCQMNDARLCLSVLLSARERGASLFNYVAVTDLIQKNGKVCGVRVTEVLTGAKYDIFANVVVNAAGPWIDDICKMEGRAYRRLRPTKGIHIVVPRITRQHAVVVASEKSHRIFFVIPWNQDTLIGTTDTNYTGDLNHIRAEKDEVSWLLRETRQLFPKCLLTEEAVISRFAGVRPLVYTENRSPSELPREGNIEWTAGGMLVLVGGKYTLFRNTAQKAVAAIIKAAPELSSRERPAYEPPLYGGDMASLEAYQNEEVASVKTLYPLREEALEYLIGAYGTKYHDILDLARRDKTLFAPLTPLQYPILAEAVYAVRNEMAVRLSDFMRRRSFIALGKFKRSPELIDQVARQMAKELEWSRDRMDVEIQAYLEEIDGT